MKKLSNIKKDLLIAAIVILSFFFAVYAHQHRIIFDSLLNIVIYVCIFLVCAAVLIGCFYLLFVKKYPVHKVFLITGSAIAFISLIINNPGIIPDEPAHLSNTYLWSNRLLWIPETKSGQQYIDIYKTYESYIREEDAEGIQKIVRSTSTYEEITGSFRLFGSPEGEKLVPYQFIDLNVSPAAYFPAVLGITLARLLHLGCVPMLYLGKLFMMAFYILGIYWSIKRMPFGKITMFIIAMLPMCIHLAPSFSYDSVIITFAMIVTAQIMYLAYGEIKRLESERRCFAAL